ncbi:MAG: hypothetical protein ACYCY2_06690 [Acidithiobacillus ferriphilus]|uniref:hypothetical protein n=1 Tax=Acidithiobacillus ferriphilus TaxID=1689834 RepID=UPI001C06E113|nr:hypothetical protein [Acidithiobacillus ferriphilus]
MNDCYWSDDVICFPLLNVCNQSDTALSGSDERMTLYFTLYGEIVSCKPKTVQPLRPPHPGIRARSSAKKRPFKLQEVWAIRISLQLASRTRDLALFDLAIDSKLRGCDLVALRVSDVAHGQSLLYRAIVLQRKT